MYRCILSKTKRGECDMKIEESKLKQLTNEWKEFVHYELTHGEDRLLHHMFWSEERIKDYLDVSITAIKYFEAGIIYMEVISRNKPLDIDIDFKMELYRLMVPVLGTQRYFNSEEEEQLINKVLQKFDLLKRLNLK